MTNSVPENEESEVIDNPVPIELRDALFDFRAKKRIADEAENHYKRLLAVHQFDAKEARGEI